jgi:probable HAF family extracellular repeat protein
MFLVSLTNWLKPITRASASRRDRRRRQRWLPRLEALEDRLVPSYFFQTIDDPNAGTASNGYQGTFPISINSSGTVCGNYGDANNVTHGMLYSNGQFTTFDDPVAATGPFKGTNAYGINNKGQIVGFYWGTDGKDHGFLLSGGTYTTIDEPNAGRVSEIEAISDSGRMVGWYLDTSGVEHGFMLWKGTFTTLDDPNAGTASGQGTYAFGLSESGQIVGEYLDSNYDQHGFLLNKEGQYTTLDDPNAANGSFQGTIAGGINGAGTIVGSYYDANNALHGFALNGGTYTDVNDPSAGNGAFQGTAIDGINASGSIEGVYYDSNNVTHGFVAAPGKAPSGPNLAVVGADGVSAGTQVNTVGGNSAGRAATIVVAVPVANAVDGGISNRIYVASATGGTSRITDSLDALFASGNDVIGSIPAI